MPNEYKQKNKNSLLTFGLKDDILPHSLGLTNVIDVWKKLKNLETPNKIGTLSCGNILTSLKMVALDSVKNHVKSCRY